ncbi:MAG: hypothetical protein ABIU54_05045 [Candidatus Eisenbacteria bacterium]
MIRTRMTWEDLIVVPLVLVAAAAAWTLHAQAWDLGGRSPILNYDTAQYAIAARELGWHGRLATPYALPIELVAHAEAPWPLAVVQPGLVLVEALVFKLVPAIGGHAGSDPRAWLTLIPSFCFFLMLAGSLALSVRHLYARWWPDAAGLARHGAALTLGLAFALDPEAQHFAIGGFTELPFTLGMLFLLLGLALEAPTQRPFLFGLVMGVTGLFRANMLWLAPLFVLAGLWCSPRERRVRVGSLLIAGFALVMSAWWIYKWHMFGTPTWDLTRFVMWDHVAGMDWFNLYHLPRYPQIPSGAEAWPLLAKKLATNLPIMTTAMLLGPRGLLIGGLAAWLVTARAPRPLRAAGFLSLVAAALGVVAASLSIPWLRYLFPTRILLEPMALLALWALIARTPAAMLGEAGRRAIQIAVAVLVLAWAGWSTGRGLDEARADSQERGVPSTSTITAISVMLNERLTPGETVMSNLGPALAWQTNHSVIHLALTPADVESCRRLHEFRHILLAFRTGKRAWNGWQEIMEREGSAATIEGLRVIEEKRFTSFDGFGVVWLQLGPMQPAMATAQVR